MVKKFVFDPDLESVPELPDADFDFIANIGMPFRKYRFFI